MLTLCLKIAYQGMLFGTTLLSPKYSLYPPSPNGMHKVSKKKTALHLYVGILLSS